ncbi:MAG: SH3 domain-containing protein [Candidatus Omnitrophica bacterium]|nr:SH3 domain-containing protein [Candidatus Omnitrophota bacterium]
MRSWILFLFIILCSPAWAENVLNYSAPGELPGITREMRTPGFWIARHPDPDGLVMGPVEIGRFNAALAKENLTKDLADLSAPYDGLKLKNDLGEALRKFGKGTFFEESGRQAGAAFYGRAEKEADLSEIPREIEPRFGFIVQQADARLLPTGNALYAKPGDVDFDELQNSGLDLATPVLILHKSYSGQWLLVRDAIAIGWVETARVAFVSKDEFVSYLNRRDVVVAVEPKVDVYLDQRLTKYAGTVRMGTRFVLKNAAGRAVEILLPQRQSNGSVEFVPGFVSREDVSFSFLPFTPRVILRQAFKMLNAPYGWGDMHGEQDCSRFIQMVFATTGLVLPRNSGEQGRVGDMLSSFAEDSLPDEKRVAITQEGVSGLTLLRLKGHIMLYLGAIKGRPYAIHEAWAYREKTPQGERPRVMGKVIVSGLDLGSGSAKGSFLARIISARTIR